jgi:UDP-glucose 4-epimerase
MCSGRGRSRLAAFGVISLFIKALHEKRQPTIYGDGGQTRDFTYVTNVVDGVIRAAETPGVGGQVFNVATNGRISLNQLLATLNKVFGTNLEPIYKRRAQGDVRDSQRTSARPRSCWATNRSSVWKRDRARR